MTLGASGLGRAAFAGTVERDVAIDLAVAMIESPHALIDTANEYDGGRSEEVIGIALRHSGVTGPAPVVTKVDRDLDSGVFDRDRVLRSYDESLARLGVDRVSLLHLHDPFTITFDQASGRDGAIAGMIELREAGAVDAIGIAAGPISMVRPFVETGLFDAVLVHNRYTIVDQSARALFADARSRGMTVFNAAPFGAGLLAKGSGSGARYGYSDTTAQLRAWVARAEDVCRSYRVDLKAVALAFSLRAPLIDSTVVSASSTARLAQLDELAATPIPDAVWDELDALGPAPTNLDDGEPDD
ncbi:aldo/keto reductase [Microbacterium sp. AK031]|uniref:aldo/keto reductase n=1 Tax=Microbacterium sp. AK031 TaxID=2723076 RepID=UPI002168CBD8|nr:aldo/keto reductase [Microbacterium sp. AK031]MCS3844077.1 D-threo-aldose 1-dehydrogenase [Microbacterium sp. AK031]